MVSIKIYHQSLSSVFTCQSFFFLYGADPVRASLLSTPRRLHHPLILSTKTINQPNDKWIENSNLHLSPHWTLTPSSLIKPYSHTLRSGLGLESTPNPGFANQRTFL